VLLFEKVVGQIKSLRDDFSVQSKAKPDNALNLFKLGFVNEKLAEANRILIADYRPFTAFEQFDTDSLPTNSDVQLVLSQYLACLERWRSAHVVFNDTKYEWYWRVKSEEIKADPATRPPSIEDRR
jgi:hypothetical protein